MFNCLRHDGLSLKPVTLLVVGLIVALGIGVGPSAQASPQSTVGVEYTQYRVAPFQILQRVDPYWSGNRVEDSITYKLSERTIEQLLLERYTINHFLSEVDLTISATSTAPSVANSHGSKLPQIELHPQHVQGPIEEELLEGTGTTFQNRLGLRNYEIPSTGSRDLRLNSSVSRHFQPFVQQRIQQETRQVLARLVHDQQISHSLRFQQEKSYLRA